MRILFTAISLLILLPASAYCQGDATARGLFNFWKSSPSSSSSSSSSSPSKVVQEKEKTYAPRIRLYRERGVKRKGGYKQPDELNATPGNINQAIQYYFGHEQNCARAPLDDADQLYDTEWYYPNVQTIFIIHDKCGSPSDPYVSGILEALRMRDFWINYNIMTLDFPDFMCETKDKIVSYLLWMDTEVQVAAKQLTAFFKSGLKSRKIYLDQINFIGLGLGAQVAGEVARALNSGKDKVRTIVGLNPTKFFRVTHVSKDDALQVQLLHTYSPDYGTPKRVGTVDIVFNGADTKQPMCKDTIPECSHTRCFQIFPAIITMTSRFQTWRCPSWQAFVKDSSQCAQDYGWLFYPPDGTLNGTYYLRVSGSFPYGIGEDGMKFDKKTLDEEKYPDHKQKINKRNPKPGTTKY